MDGSRGVSRWMGVGCVSRWMGIGVCEQVDGSRGV